MPDPMSVHGLKQTKGGGKNRATAVMMLLIIITRPSLKVHWSGHYGKQCGGHHTLETELPRAPATPLLSTRPGKAAV